MEGCPASAAKSMSFIIFKRAVSVLRWALEPDWRDSNKELSDKKAESIFATIFSKTLANNKGSLEIGLKLLKSFELSPGFFNKGWITAFLKLYGTVTEERELFKTFSIKGQTVLETSLRNSFF